MTTTKSGLTNAAFIGVHNFHIAELISDEAGKAPVYGESIYIPRLREISVKPTVDNATLYADNGACETATAISDYKLTIATASLPLEYRAKLLGHKLDENGVMQNGANDSAPYFAVMFESDKSNGKRRFVRLTKVKFSEPSDDFKTKEEKINYNTPSMEATAIYRESDKVALEQLDEEMETFTDAAAKDWYTLTEKSGS
ncbi:putative phage major tail protein [Selenomonas ruminantium subsp. lactilytica TAM6421]|uniref:Putative phage major tail protein n=1 Tax=Selenomonas ruminantium subsp. lactilytica (strain NBRC 103574 / TAM6421) TaxID=927704 RepID=I0GRY7_SELRL|nr:major tail protein [Selenomonas ruminantium]BAL83524.1 putative phage major tail protein [Selenomonas ruminantium subsp. lactilytica TAM6421]